MAEMQGGNFSLFMYFAFWYLGNSFYNIQNKKALNATGGKTAGFGMTVATLQLGIGAIYSFVIWAVGYNFLPCVGVVAPTKQDPPKLRAKEIVAMLPVAFCSAAAHSASVLALNAGSVTFGQIVKAGEPVFAAVVGTVIYGKSVSVAKWLCLPVIIGGVVFSCLKPGKVTGAYAIEYDMTALAMASVANVFAAIKGAENGKLMKTEGLKEKIGGVGNQFALTEVLGFFISLPVMLYLEGGNFFSFINMFMTDSLEKSSSVAGNKGPWPWSKASTQVVSTVIEGTGLQYNLLASGMTFYLYNELATMTIKKTSPLAASVANTAKRVIVMLVSAVVFGEQLTFEKKLGAGIAIFGVFLYSVIDDLLKPKSKTE
uniref:Sugar phosphate transporter domain-containing protein n=1 Tax=Coccolithus braarudii TaxID=221442 RepID=A0A7S0Q088_9EUKA|mmetsp:Transcript_22519/g.48629  ORF Transcript_22519/g.48629 Transcript_22519/m.48629 type:complete len:371 (+) Transcript_22519:20-1132(+)|eukprot:CAMPEP_0183342658 /NCGR_PEP_ID=MMETSP0164_2-20130417/8731_1 /TAXON_ID=221442 /ORGANISM="Coccolithus pelagicus ssp braarudi, Strain PLY182g" /LENGTH=370 /DNA_ID=CAMNT_0025513319 /DNA_START=22 /DNA_END=1134 /DNA_ORIENTATION=-